MSKARVLREIERFLSTPDPEVLSISGRWGVGKTHTWDNAISQSKHMAPLKRYAYVSAFGMRSIDELKTAIVQSTVRLDAAELEPTVDSFFENVQNLESAQILVEKGVRKGLGVLQWLRPAVPIVGKAADLLAPGATLLIRKQIICIDDIERSGQGLGVADIFGLVSSLRERRGCKVVLLLNEEGLGDEKSTFREYLEKVVDQAIRFEPTAEESANDALEKGDSLISMLKTRTIALGITNIRVIRRIRRFLSFVEPQLSNRHAGVRERVVQSIALLGWSVFEPNLAPKLARIRQHSRYTRLLSSEKRSDEDAITDSVLSTYEFPRFEDIDAVLLDGLQAGGFDETALAKELAALQEQFTRSDARSEIDRPWIIFRQSFDDDVDEFVTNLIKSIENHASVMNQVAASEAFSMLRALGREDKVSRLVQIYMNAHATAPREFFEALHKDQFGKIDPALQQVIEQRLKSMPLERDPTEVLLKIYQNNGWHPDEIAFLASLSVDQYFNILKNARDQNQRILINTALQFGRFENPSEEYKSIAHSMIAALRKISREGPLNEMRVKQYLGDTPTADEAEDHEVG